MSKLPPVMNEDFISEFNKNKPPQEFFDVCKLAEELIDIHNVGKKVGKCKYYDTCPSCSGWCNNRQPSGECVEFLINAYERIERKDDGRMTNEEMTLEALKLCRKTRIFIPANEYLDTAINSLEENDKLKAEIEQLKEDYGVLERQYNNVENSSIRYYNEVKQLKAELEKLDKYNSELCMELTITMDKLCLAEKEVERLRK